MNKEVEYLKEHLYEIYKYKRSMKDLTYDMDIEHLLRTCKALDYSQKEIERLNNIINELEKCVQNYIYAIEPRGCSINYNCEYDSEEDYINAMKEQSKLNTFKFILDKIKELKGSDKE